MRLGGQVHASQQLSLNDNLKIYFGNKTEYVKSLNTNNFTEIN